MPNFLPHRNAGQSSQQLSFGVSQLDAQPRFVLGAPITNVWCLFDVSPHETNVWCLEGGSSQDEDTMSVVWGWNNWIWLQETQIVSTKSVIFSHQAGAWKKPCPYHRRGYHIVIQMITIFLYVLLEACEICLAKIQRKRGPSLRWAMLLLFLCVWLSLSFMNLAQFGNRVESGGPVCPPPRSFPVLLLLLWQECKDSWKRSHANSANAQRNAFWYDVVWLFKQKLVASIFFLGGGGIIWRR